MDKNKKRLLRLKKLKTDSELAIFDHVNDLEDKVEDIANKLDSKVETFRKEIPNLGDLIKSVRGEKGEDGEPGRDADEQSIISSVLEQVLSQLPENGKDGHTPTNEELQALIIPLLPKVSNGIDGKDAVVDYEKIVWDVIKQIPTPKDGRDGSPDMAEDIRNKLELLEGEERLDKSAVKGIEEIERKITQVAQSGGNGIATTSFFNGLRAKNLTVIGATATQNGDTVNITLPTTPPTSILLETPSGTIDGSNTTFTVTNNPIMLFSDGVAKFSGLNYTYSSGTITWTDGSPPALSLRSLHT